MIVLASYFSPNQSPNTEAPRPIFAPPMTTYPHMIPAYYSFTCWQGSTFLESFTCTDSSGTAINFTGCSGSMDVRDASGTLVVTLSTTNGRMTLGGSAGTVSLTITATDSAALTPGTYSYDLRTTTTGAEKDYWLYGPFVINPRVTTT